MTSKLPIALGAIVIGCVGQPMAKYSPAEKPTDLPPQKLYAAAEGVLLDEGYLIEKREPENFRLETKQRTLPDSDINKNKYEYFWIVQTAGGTLKLKLECQLRNGAAIEDCGTKRPEKLVRQQDKLLEDILHEARGD